MALLADGKRVALRAWSAKLALLSALLSAVEIGVQVLAVVRPTPWFAMAAAVTSLAAGIARIVAQPAMRDPK